MSTIPEGWKPIHGGGKFGFLRHDGYIVRPGDFYYWPAKKRTRVTSWRVVDPRGNIVKKTRTRKEAFAFLA